MKNTVLLRRLCRLERRMNPEAYVRPLVIEVPLGHPQRELAPGERIVVDTIRRSGWLTETYERITTDPNDAGSVVVH